MIFSSIPFLYYFLPVVLLLYYIVPKKLKNGALLLASLVFYAWGEPKLIWVMAVSILLTYGYGILIEKYQEGPWGRIFLSLSVGTSIGLLGYFKYADFLLENLNYFLGTDFPVLGILLPIGISFYTFQLLSYTVDVYRKQVPAQKNLITLAAYITMFPQLIAGPIVRYQDVEEQLRNRKHSGELFFGGIRRFLIGLSKKILIANTLGELCEIFRASQEKSVLFFWIYGIAVMQQIYFDFSGYSDMAIGLGKMFGFNFLENFSTPYISRSMTEFWRRWHISLGTWFRDYVYIPLGGNRVPRTRWIFNLLVVWILTGFWHGASWNFMVWGLMFGILLIGEKLYYGEFLKKHKIFSHSYVLFLVMISFMIFQAADLREAWQDIIGLFGIPRIPLVSSESIYYAKSYGMTLFIGAIGCGPWVRIAAEKCGKQKLGEKFLWILEPAVMVLLLLVCTAYLVDGSYNPFLYFRF